MTVFTPDFGPKGIWISIFTSVSAFCNAGIDIIAENSLCDYALNPMVNTVTCLLIVIGGIGYIVWWDIIRVIKNIRQNKRKIFRNLTLHSKIAIISTLLLIIVGAILVFVLEYDNPQTLKDYTLLQKIEVSFFQSVTTRTAGFATLPQENLTNATAVVCLLLMFIGGSPVGTAGGIKTVTFAVIIASAWASICNKKIQNCLEDAWQSKLSVRQLPLPVCLSLLCLFQLFCCLQQWMPIYWISLMKRRVQPPLLGLQEI